MDVIGEWTTTMKKMGIIVIGYNRIDSILRLLSALENAKYEGDDVPLVISIDHGNNDQLIKVVSSFSWNHGPKYLEIQTENLGLRKHVLKCGSYMSKYGFDAVAVFEDDILPSPGFYNFMKQAVDFFWDDEGIAGISLYSNQWNAQSKLPFEPLKGDFDVYFMNMAQSWGQIWMRHKWDEFITWYDNNLDKDIWKNIPQYIRKWPESSWLKYHTAYCVENNKYFVYPYNSLTTCFAEKGVHTVEHVNIYQVPFEFSENRKFAFIESENGDVFYDVYMENKSLGKYVSIDDDSLMVSLYGTKMVDKNTRYLLTKKDMPYKVIRSFDLECRPHECNVILGVEGNIIKLYDTKIIEKHKQRTEIVDNSYYFRFNRSGKWMVEYAFKQKMRTIRNGLFSRFGYKV